MTLEEELYGADYFEHNIEPPVEVREYAEKVLRHMSKKERETPAYVSVRSDCTSICRWCKKHCESPTTSKTVEVDCASGDVSSESPDYAKDSQMTEQTTHEIHNGSIPCMELAETGRDDEVKGNGTVTQPDQTSADTCTKHTSNGHGHINKAFHDEGENIDNEWAS